jgi:hypothetical protein
MLTADQLRQRQSEALINMKPVSVVLRRAPITPDGAGGWVKGVPVNLPAQTMRLVPASPVTNDSGARATANGRMVTPTWLLIAEHDADILNFDECDVLGHNLEVVYVNDVPTERIVAECWEES